MNGIAVKFSMPFWRRLSQPFFILLFLYFFFVSAELLNVSLMIFKFRINLLIGLAVAGLFLIRFHVLRYDRDFLNVALGCVGSMLASAVAGGFFNICVFFIILYIFNYVIFFVFPTNLFRIFDDPSWILKLYFTSFVAVGMIAAAQVFFSIFGIVLPGVGQSICSLSRGQGFSYEPSYYALYMTPYATFETVKYFLQERKDRKIGRVLGANLLLIVSTSTGCFFSYLVLILSLGALKFLRIIRRVSFARIFGQCLGVLVFFGWILWIVYPELIYAGFLKLFWSGIVNHYTFITRWQGILKYWKIFCEQPFLGVGMGAAPFYLIQKQPLWVLPDGREIMSNESPSNVAMEVLASLGVVGAFVFGCFFWMLWKNCRSTLRLGRLTSEERINVISFTVSLCVMFFALLMNQSIMRPYTWLHVGICMGYMKYLQSRYE